MCENMINTAYFCESTVLIEIVWNVTVLNGLPLCVVPNTEQAMLYATSKSYPRVLLNAMKPIKSEPFYYQT